MSAFLAVTGAVARRNIRHSVKNPALIVPAIVFPLIFLMAFAGGLSAIDDVPGFDFRSGYTSFQFVFVFLQAAAFGGAFGAFAIATDFESGFMRRLFLAAPSRAGILAGIVISSTVRFAITATAVTLVGFLAGMQVDGSAGQFAGLLALGFLLNMAFTLFGAGFFMRTKTVQAAPAMQMPVFVGLFLAPVYVPLDLLDGWIGTLASGNPLTALIEAGRGLISGVPDDTGLAFAVVAGIVALFAAFAVTGLRRAESGR